MLALTTLLACLLLLFRPDHRGTTVTLATFLAVNWGAARLVLPPAWEYLIFPAADLCLVVVAVYGTSWKLGVGAGALAWLLAGATYGGATPLLAHGFVGGLTLGGLLQRDGEETPEATAAALLGLSDLAAIYPLSRPRELWAETARPQSLIVWTILAALEIYWLWRHWPPSSSWWPASGRAGC